MGTFVEEEVEFDFGLDLTWPGTRLLVDLMEPMTEVSRGLPLGIPLALDMARAT